MLGRQIRLPIVSTYNHGDTILYGPTRQSGQRGTYLMPKGLNTSFIMNGAKLILASNSDISPLSLQPAESSHNQLQRRVTGLAIADSACIDSETRTNGSDITDCTRRHSTVNSTVPDSQPRRSSRMRFVPARYGLDGEV